jgi:predicted aminopeptidase
MASVLSILTSGCTTLGFYAQSVAGHLAVLSASKPISEWVEDEATDPILRERLLLAARIRAFSVSELKQPANASYNRYADIRREAVIWNVVAAPELDLALNQWCFPVVGCVVYRGYFERADALAFAQILQAQGLDVRVYGVAAYSTLGRFSGAWFADPLLNTFIHRSEGELAGLIFHELAHQVVFAEGDTEFNESFATAVEHIGSTLWLRAHSNEKWRGEQARFEDRQQTFRNLTASYKKRLKLLYSTPATDADKRSAKQQLLLQMRQEYEAIKKERWGGFAGYDVWFAQANNASLGILEAYSGLTPQFVRLFERHGRDFAAFYADVQRIAALPARQRRTALL